MDKAVLLSAGVTTGGAKRRCGRLVPRFVAWGILVTSGVAVHVRPRRDGRLPNIRLPCSAPDSMTLAAVRRLRRVVARGCAGSCCRRGWSR
jgi:hypothetical protein